MMISSEFLMVAGVVTAVLWVPAGLRLYKYSIPIHWAFALSFILGSLGISLFYYEIDYGLLNVNLTQLSRVLWSLVLMTTSLLALSVLVRRW